MNFFGKTDVGQHREVNQDCFGAYALSTDSALLLVCDGMGGESGGEIASGLALESFTQHVIKVCKPKLSPDNTLELTERDATLMLKNAIAAANTAVFEYAKNEPSLLGMGTTLVGALVLEGGRYVFWISAGDSRLYKINKEEIVQINHDHSYVQYLIDIGEISPTEAAVREDKNLITKAVGIDELLSADFDAFEVTDWERETGTYLLLCSDGLTNTVSEADMQAIVTREGLSVEEKSSAVIQMANANGGDDNITAVLIKL